MWFYCAIFTLLVGGTFPAELLLASIPVCQINSYDFENCILQATETIRPLLQAGIPNLGIPPISPYPIAENIPYTKVTDRFILKNLFYNVVITGLDRYRFTSFKYDFQKHRLTAYFNIDNLEIRGNYILTAKLLENTYDGEGTFVFNITKSSGTIKQVLNVNVREGVSYLVPTLDLSSFYLGDVRYVYNGLLGDEDSPRLRAIKNDIDTYVADVIEPTKQTFAAKIEKIIQNVIQGMYRIPYNKLFLVDQQLPLVSS